MEAKTLLIMVKRPIIQAHGVSLIKCYIEANVVGTPGVGFGPSGEGYIRLTAFGERENCIEAMRRIRNWIK